MRKNVLFAINLLLVRNDGILVRCVVKFFCGLCVAHLIHSSSFSMTPREDV